MEKHLKRGLTFTVQVHGVPGPITLDHSQKTVGKVKIAQKRKNKKYAMMKRKS